MEQPQAMVPILLSFIAVIVSFAALYLSHLRRARLSVLAGEDVVISHDSYDSTLAIALPVTIENHGARLGTVIRVALLIQNEGSEEGYLLEPVYFQNINKKGDYSHESFATAITVEGKKSITKLILFSSSSEDDFTLVDRGTYEMCLVAWPFGPEKPTLSYSFSVVLSEKNSDKLKNYLKNKENSTIRIPQSRWRQWAAHHLTEGEVKTLLKKI